MFAKKDMTKFDVLAQYIAVKPLSFFTKFQLALILRSIKSSTELCTEQTHVVASAFFALGKYDKSLKYCEVGLGSASLSKYIKVSLYSIIAVSLYMKNEEYEAERYFNATNELLRNISSSIAYIRSADELKALHLTHLHVAKFYELIGCYKQKKHSLSIADTLFRKYQAISV